MNFLLPLSALLMGCTIYERICGTSLAHAHIYDALWFHLLWGVVIVYAGYRCVRSGMWKRPLTALLHLSFVCIAMGVCLTTFTATRGTINFRQGTPTAKFLTNTNRVITLPEELTLEGVHTNQVNTYYLLRSDRNTLHTLGTNAVVQIGAHRLYLTNADADLQGVNVKIIIDKYGRYTSHLGFYLFFVTLLLELIGWVFKTYRQAKYNTSFTTDSRHRTLIFRCILFTCSSTCFLLKWAHQGFVPLITITDTLLVVSIILSLSPLFVPNPKNSRFQIIVHLCGWALFITALLTNDCTLATPPALPQALNSPWLSIHVTTIISAYSLLIICAIHSFISVLHKKGIVNHPSLKSSQALLRLSVYLLTAGIIFGALWAGETWGDYWSWDAKEVWALITLLLYAIPLHQAPTSNHYHHYILTAFLALLMTYFGVTYLLGGMHAY